MEAQPQQKANPVALAIEGDPGFEGLAVRHCKKQAKEYPVPQFMIDNLIASFAGKPTNNSKWRREESYGLPEALKNAFERYLWPGYFDRQN